MVQPVGLPLRQVCKRPRVPPERNHSRLAAFGGPTAESNVRPSQLNPHIRDLKLRHLADAQAAADSEAEVDQILARGVRAGRIDELRDTDERNVVPVKRLDNLCEIEQ